MAEPKYVYLIIDSSWGVQGAFSTPSVAAAHLSTGRYTLGRDAYVSVYEVIDESPNLRAKGRRDDQ
jgi:hypothetical protein